MRNLPLTFDCVYLFFHKRGSDKISTVSDPRIPVYSNFESAIYRDARIVKKILPRQLVNNVKWEAVINNLMKYKSEDQWPRMIECGPGNSLTAITKQISGKFAKRSSIVPA